MLNTYQGAPGLLRARDWEGLLVEESLCNYRVSWKYQNIYGFFICLFFLHWCSLLEQSLLPCYSL